MHTSHSTGTSSGESSGSKSFESICGITIAIFAAVLAINELGAGKFGDDEILGANERASAYAWYQSKSIKESLAEGQRDLLQSLMKSGAIQAHAQKGIQSQIDSFDVEAKRYQQEKKEILLGSSAMPKEQWRVESGGVKGKVVGAQEWEKKLELLSIAGDRFDLATLFLQLCLVIGAISLVLREKKTVQNFYRVMIALGILGAVFSVYGYFIALKI